MNRFLTQFISQHCHPTKLATNGLPVYSESEEVFNTLSHAVGIFLGIGVIITSFYRYHSELGLIGGLIFGVSLIVAYIASSIYHGTPRRYYREKRWFQVFDHSGIFVLVAGTSTPFILGMIHRAGTLSNWLFYGSMWLIAAIGITLLAVNMRKYMRFTTIMYVIMGIAVVTQLDPLSKIVGSTGIALFLIGGAVYLIGLICYGLGTKVAWFHSVFHVLCIVASLLHCACILGYLI